MRDRLRKSWSVKGRQVYYTDCGVIDLGVFVFKVTFITETQGRQKVAKFYKIFKNNSLKILKFFFQGTSID